MVDKACLLGLKSRPEITVLRRLFYLAHFFEEKLGLKHGNCNLNMSIWVL